MARQQVSPTRRKRNAAQMELLKPRLQALGILMEHTFYHWALVGDNWTLSIYPTTLRVVDETNSPETRTRKRVFSRKLDTPDELYEAVVERVRFWTAAEDVE